MSLKINDERQALTKSVEKIEHNDEQRMSEERISFADSITKQGMKTEAPRDPYNIVYCIILLHGIGVLMPWNMFITIAPSYFVEYKLVETLANGTHIKTPYSLNFFSYIGICSQLPNFLLNLVNLFIQLKGGLGKRISISLVIVSIICAITIILAAVDTSSMITAFFYITMGLVILLNAANGVYQNSMFGLVATFPPSFTNAIVLGNNLCGTFVSVISIITLSVSETVKGAAIAYFAIALITVIGCFISFQFLPRFEFFNYYMQKREIIDGDQDKEENQISKTQLYISVFKKIWVQCLNVFLVFFVTLTIFPAIMGEVKLYTENKKYDFFIPEFLFTPITTFLLFNAFAFIGSTLANFVQWPKPRYLIIPVVLRLLLIPIMMFCNYRPELRSWPVFFTNVYFYIVMGVIMSITSGYFSSLAMMYAPRLVEESKAPTAGMMSAFFLITGISTGIIFTFAVSYFTDYMGPLKKL